MTNPRGGVVPETGEVDGAGGVGGFLAGAGRHPGAQDGILVATAGSSV